MADSKLLRVGILGVCVLSALAGCREMPRDAGGPAAGQGGAASVEYRFTLIIYGKPGNPFWTKVVAGAEEAAEKLGCSVDVQFAGNDAARQNDILETAMANRIDGIRIALNYDDAYDDNIRRARELDIPVIAFNIDDSQGPEGNLRMAYIGQDMEEAGYQIGQRLVEEGGLQEGDHVVCPVEHPEAVYAVQRYAGVRRALEGHGIESEVLQTGAISLENTLNKLTQYLLGHRETDAICAMGGMPMEVTPQACEEVGMDLPNAGFDLTRGIARNIKEGKSIATVDQQPFYQGFLTVLQLFYNREYGLLPCDINTGGAMVDASTVDAVLELADTIR